jgi:hypothetical protein
MQSLLSGLNSPNGLIVLVCVGCVVIFTLKNWLILQMSHNKSITLFVLYPGVVIHELSHILFCVLLGARIKKFQLFDSGSGYVEYASKDRSVTRDFLISVAPLLVGGALLYLALKLLSVDYGYLIKILMIYVCFSVFLSMFPSRKDLLNALWVYIGLFVAIIIFRSKIFSFEHFSENIAILVLFTVSFLAIVNLLIYLVRRVWKLK